MEWLPSLQLIVSATMPSGCNSLLPNHNFSRTLFGDTLLGNLPTFTYDNTCSTKAVLRLRWLSLKMGLIITQPLTPSFWTSLVDLWHLREHTYLLTKEFIDKSRHCPCCDITSQRLTNRRRRKQFSKRIWPEQETHALLGEVGGSGLQSQTTGLIPTSYGYLTLTMRLCESAFPKSHTTKNPLQQG